MAKRFIDYEERHIGWHFRKPARKMVFSKMGVCDFNVEENNEELFKHERTSGFDLHDDHCRQELSWYASPQKQTNVTAEIVRGLGRRSLKK